MIMRNGYEAARPPEERSRLERPEMARPSIRMPNRPAPSTTPGPVPGQDGDSTRIGRAITVKVFGAWPRRRGRNGSSE